MSNLETTEPDPAATSISNNETVNKTGADSSAPTDVAAAKAEVEAVPEAKKDEKADTEMGNTAEATPTKENGDDVSVKKENGSPPVKKEYHEKKSYNNRNGGYRNGGFRGENKSKYDSSVLEPSEDPAKMRGQVEFYFSDSNLPEDEHMWELTDGTANKPVLIKKIHSFKRMHRYESYEQVVAALKDSKFLQVAGEEGSEVVNRRVAYDPNARTTATHREPRYLYVKGFGEEEPSSQFDIEAYFNAHGPTNSVRLRRSQDRGFKGSVFVEFQDDETANSFLALDPKPLWQGKHKLEAQSKASYCEQKDKDIADGKIVPTESWGINGNRGRGRGGGRGRGYNNRDNRGGGDRRDRGDRDPDDWKKRREEDRASGFKDSRERSNRGNKGGRGGRGRRDDRGPRNNDRNRERNGDKDSKRDSSPSKAIKKEDAESSKPTEEAPSKTTEENPSKKRSRDEDDVGEGAPAKKVDSKSEAPVAATS